MKIFSEELVEKAAKECKVADLSRATIGEVLLVAQYLEKETGIPFIRMDQGSPGLPVNQAGVEAEKAALDRGVGSQYPAAAGVPELKIEASRFVKAFMNVDISPRSCVPTVGSVAGSYGSFIDCSQRIPGKNKVLFIDPGFPIQKSQLRIIGADWVEFDIYKYRGDDIPNVGGIYQREIDFVHSTSCCWHKFNAKTIHLRDCFKILLAHALFLI